MSHPRVLWTTSLVLLIVTATTLGALYGASLTARSATASEPGTTQPPTLSIAGHGVLKLTPDRVKLYITISAEEKTAQAATTEAAAIFSQLLAKLEPQGLGRADVETTSYMIRPVYEYISNRAPILRGYAAQHGLLVTVKATDITRLGAKAGQVIDAIVSAGITQVGGLSFTVADDVLHALRREALPAAGADARAKADLMASALGLRITGVQIVNESSFLPPPPFLAVRTAAETKAQVASELIPGSFEVTATVHVAFTVASASV